MYIIPQRQMIQVVYTYSLFSLYQIKNKLIKMFTKISSGTQVSFHTTFYPTFN